MLRFCIKLSGTHFTGMRQSGCADAALLHQAEYNACYQDMERPSSDSHGDDWELDPSDVTFLDRIASGAFGDLFRGNYCGQDVAIKVLKNVQDDSQQYREFLQVCFLWQHHRRACTGACVWHMHCICCRMR